MSVVGVTDRSITRIFKSFSKLRTLEEHSLVEKMTPKNNRKKNQVISSKVTEDDIMGFYRLFSNQSEKLSKLSDLYKGLNEVNWQLTNGQNFN